MNTISAGNRLFPSYSHLSSGKRINTAADDAAGLAIGQKMQKEETGLRVGGQNAQEGIGVLNVADGALDCMWKRRTVRGALPVMPMTRGR